MAFNLTGPALYDPIKCTGWATHMALELLDRLAGNALACTDTLDFKEADIGIEAVKMYACKTFKYAKTLTFKRCIIGAC